MTLRFRIALLVLAFAVLAFPVWRVAVALPAFGHPTSGYGEAINTLMPFARHVANMVTVVNFDVRGIDTLGEEMMLIAAVTGTVVLLRGSHGESPADRAEQRRGRKIVGRSDATIFLSRIWGPALIVFGLYVVAMGTETPGGGFQAGAIIATGFVMVYLGDGYDVWRIVLRGPVLGLFEGGGGLVFVLAAAVPLLMGHAALENVLPLGTYKSMAAGGLMIVGNWAVTFAVAGSFGFLALEFLEETRAAEEGEDDATKEDPE